jgi:hypothetical protein
MRHAELQVTTHFSFLRGASSAEELVFRHANFGRRLTEELFATAAALGIDAIGVVDRNSLAILVPDEADDVYAAQLGGSLRSSEIGHTYRFACAVGPTTGCACITCRTWRRVIR